VGLIVLSVTPFVRSPALVVLLTYFGLWTVGATIVLYPALSLVGMYGDWIAIYTAPLTNWKVVIATIHVALIALLAFLIYGQAPRLWFVRKSNPTWDTAYRALMQRIEKHGEPEDYLSLAWLFYEAGLNSSAQQFVTKFVSLSSHSAESRLLQALLLQSQGKIDQAIASLQELLADQNTPADLTASAQAALKQCERARLQQ
jgi:tetratricopeptide (TPR) repeat protein